MTDPIIIILVLKNIIKLTKGSLNNIFQDSFNKILSQQLTHNILYLSNKGLYSPTIPENILCLLQIFLHLEAFECNTTSDWLNHLA